MNISSLSSGALQRPDLSEMRAKIFSKSDSDGNGTLSKAEFTKGMKEAPTRPAAPDGTSAPSASDMFDAMDTDGNGEVSTDEMKAFDDSREEEMKTRMQEMVSGSVNGFSGSTDFLTKILEALKSDSSSSTSAVSSADSTDSSSSSSSTTSNATTKELIEALLQKLKEERQQYQADGSSLSSGSASLFNKVV